MHLGPTSSVRSPPEPLHLLAGHPAFSGLELPPPFVVRHPPEPLWPHQGHPVNFDSGPSSPTSVSTESVPFGHQRRASRVKTHSAWPRATATMPPVQCLTSRLCIPATESPPSAALDAHHGSSKALLQQRYSTASHPVGSFNLSLPKSSLSQKCMTQLLQQGEQYMKEHG